MSFTSQFTNIRNDLKKTLKILIYLAIIELIICPEARKFR